MRRQQRTGDSHGGRWHGGGTRRLPIPRAAAATGGISGGGADFLSSLLQQSYRVEPPGSGDMRHGSEGWKCLETSFRVRIWGPGLVAGCGCPTAHLSCCAGFGSGLVRGRAGRAGQGRAGLGWADCLAWAGLGWAAAWAGLGWAAAWAVMCWPTLGLAAVAAGLAAWLGWTGHLAGRAWAG